MSTRQIRRRGTGLGVAAVILALLGTVGACSRATPAATSATDSGPATELRLGFLPNVTHAAALIGIDRGFFGKELASTKLVTQSFNAGPTEMDALLGGSLDAIFIGSGPPINIFAKYGPQSVRLVAGAASGGAQFVVRSDINSPQDLVGKTVATPQLANTQDVSLKKWLAQHELTGKVAVTNLDNSATLTAFQRGDIQGAWLPEPWASQLVLTAGAKVLVDERTLWPDGQFPTTVLVVRPQFLAEHPETVRALLRGELDAIDYANTDRAGAETAVNDQLKRLTGKSLSQTILDRSFDDLQLTIDPLAPTFPQLAADQVTAKVAKTTPSVKGLADLGQLNQLLTSAGRPAVNAAGLDGH